MPSLIGWNVSLKVISYAPRNKGVHFVNRLCGVHSRCPGNRYIRCRLLRIGVRHRCNTKCSNEFHRLCRMPGGFLSCLWFFLLVQENLMCWGDKTQTHHVLLWLFCKNPLLFQCDQPLWLHWLVPLESVVVFRYCNWLSSQLVTVKQTTKLQLSVSFCFCF